MSINDLNCKCPACGETFALGDALEEQAVEQVRAELSSLNNEELAQKLENAKKDAIEEGKRLGAKAAQEHAFKKQQQLEGAQAALDELKLAQIDKDSELQRLRHQQKTAISLKLAEQKSVLEAQRERQEASLKLQIAQLRGDLQKATARAEQGSMQSQGEASEIALEETLGTLFPNDDVIEIKKGQRGADCILIVRNSAARPVGQILFECKDTKTFSSDWVPKLKADAIAKGAQIPVLVTTSWPSGVDRAHLRDGVWICGFHEYQVLVKALRQSLIDVARVTAAEGAREGKAQVMYDFLTGQEFAHTIEQMIGPIFRMHEQLEKEKRALTRQWKERETLINGVIEGTESLYMKIQGIAQVNLPAVEGMEQIEQLGDNSSTNGE